MQITSEITSKTTQHAKRLRRKPCWLIYCVVCNRGSCRILSTVFVLGRVEKTDPHSVDYPLTTPTDYPKKSTKFRLRSRKIQEPYLLFLHDHDCMKNSCHFLLRNFSTQSISFSSHSSPATCQNAVSTMDNQ